MIDIHSHILPQIDDGSKSVDMSLRMLRESWKQGVDGIVLTPHFYADKDSPEAFLRRRQSAANRLNAQIGRLRNCPTLLLGAEVHYYRGMGHSDALRNLCVGGSGFVLIEMPFDRWNSYILQDIKEVYSRLGLRVIIAHIDRYLGLQPAGMIDDLHAIREVYFQANADFFLQRNTRRRAIKMLKNREIHFLGSDCHNMTTRAPNLGEAVDYINRKLGDQALNRIERRGIKLFRLAGAE